MRQVREVLRLKWACGLSDRQIARSLRISRPTVAGYRRRVQAAGLVWPLPEDLDEEALERRRFSTTHKTPSLNRPLPDWATVHQELQRQGVTLALLWHEYQAVPPEGLQYSSCCEAYRKWAKTLDLVMRQSHRAGETLFVDYAGQTVPVVDPLTGEVRDASIFIAVLGASNATVAEATWRERLPDWIASHVRAFEALGGVPQVLVPDNLKAAVNRAHRYEPALNRTYEALAQHYGVAVVPARVARPKDQAKVEVGGQVVERWMLARLRHHPFFSLPELHTAITGLLVDLNHRPCKKLPGSRHSLFESLDRPALRLLPVQPYEYAEWKLVRVNIDDHVEVGGHSSSVPYPLVQHQLDARISAHTVELFPKGKRIASHRRSPQKGRHTPVTAHMPKAHRHYAEWTPQRLIRWAAQTGEATARVVETILTSRAYPQQGFRACLGLMRLGSRDGDDRLEAACRRALAIGACAYTSIESILKHDLDRHPLPEKPRVTTTIDHVNIRGPTYDHEHRRPLMLTHPTLEKLPALRLTGMLQALSEQMQRPDIGDLRCDERLGLLVDREMTERSDRRLTTRLRQARFRLHAQIEDSDARHPRGLDKSLMIHLATCQWVKDRRNLLITGPTGVGKPQPCNYPCRSQRCTGTDPHRHRSPAPAVWPDPPTGRDDTPCDTRPVLCGVVAAPHRTLGACTRHQPRI